MLVPVQIEQGHPLQYAGGEEGDVPLLKHILALIVGENTNNVNILL